MIPGPSIITELCIVMNRLILTMKARVWGAQMPGPSPYLLEFDKQKIFKWKFKAQYPYFLL